MRERKNYTFLHTYVPFNEEIILSLACSCYFEAQFLQNNKRILANKCELTKI